MKLLIEQLIMLRIFKENMRTWKEAIELVDLGEKKLQNAFIDSI